MEEFTIKSLPNTFRIKKMNAIDILALRSQIDFDDFEKIRKVYGIMLENMEVKFDNSWLPVKEKDKEEYYPAGIESNVHAINELLNYFMTEFLRPVFTK